MISIQTRFQKKIPSILTPENAYDIKIHLHAHAIVNERQAVIMMWGNVTAIRSILPDNAIFIKTFSTALMSLLHHCTFIYNKIIIRKTQTNTSTLTAH